MARFQEKADAARKLEERLIAEGRQSDAQIVAKLRRSGSSAWETLKRVHRDNVQLRRQLGLPTFAESANIDALMRSDQ